IGVIEEGGPWIAGVSAAGSSPRTLSVGEPLPGAAGNYILDHALSRADSVTKTKAVSKLVELRRAGATIVLLSNDEALLESCADEIWWLRDGVLVTRGDPAEVLAQYRRHVAEALRNSGANILPRISPTMRNGDGRAVLEKIELIGENGCPSVVFCSGEVMTVRVTARFAEGVDDPVIGIMIRTRIGLNVYGTNTELEKLVLGPAGPGAELQVSWRFACSLCPGDYTVTAASHDPDGVWHDWMEDAVAFAVSDSRYTAGVVNLKAEVAVERK